MAAESSSTMSEPPRVISDADSHFSKLPQTSGICCRYIAEGRPIGPPPAPKSDYTIQFLNNDMDHPFNWPVLNKSITTFLMATTALTASFASAVISGGTEQISREFHVGGVVSALNVSLYVAGFALGPIMWGPSSELWGRRPLILVGMLGYTLFAFACATAKDYQTLIIGRFFTGIFAGSALTIGPSVNADCFDDSQRGVVISIVTLMIVAGPMISPVVGGYIGASYLGWRWTMYISGIMGSLVLLLVLFFVRESYPPKVLVIRAATMRQVSGNWALSAPLEQFEFNMHDILNRTVERPLFMLMVEPILLLICLYHGFIYGILYLCLAAVPFIFTTYYGWSGGNVYLPYIAMFIGSILLNISGIIYFEPRYLRARKRAQLSVVPEERLRMMMMGGFSFSGGIFWLCWSGAYAVHWIVPCIGLGFLGFGLQGIFLSAMNYIIDSYTSMAASALSANMLVRSGMGAAFPLFADIMFRNLGAQWAGTLLGCLAALMIPMPFVFYKFGEGLRASSRYATGSAKSKHQNDDDELSATYPMSRTMSYRSAMSQDNRSRLESILAV